MHYMFMGMRSSSTQSRAEQEVLETLQHVADLLILLPRKGTQIAAAVGLARGCARVSASQLCSTWKLLCLDQQGAADGVNSMCF